MTSLPTITFLLIPGSHFACWLEGSTLTCGVHELMLDGKQLILPPTNPWEALCCDWYAKMNFGSHNWSQKILRQPLFFLYWYLLFINHHGPVLGCIARQCSTSWGSESAFSEIEIWYRSAGSIAWRLDRKVIRLSGREVHGKYLDKTPHDHEILRSFTWVQST